MGTNTDALSSHAIHALCELLDTHLGFQDHPLLRPELMGKAEFLLTNGWSEDEAGRVLAEHNNTLDSVRVGDVLQRLDGEFWPITGYDGCTMKTHGNLLRVTEINTKTAMAKVVDASKEPKTRNGIPIFGKVSLPNYMFAFTS